MIHGKVNSGREGGISSLTYTGAAQETQHRGHSHIQCRWPFVGMLKPGRLGRHASQYPIRTTMDTRQKRTAWC